MPLEGSIYRLTGKTALMHDITDRGFIAPARSPASRSSTRQIATKPREPVATLPGGGVQVKHEAVGIDRVIVNGTELPGTAR